MSLYEFLIKPYESYTTLQILLEVAAATFGLLSVLFSVKRNILVYPTGIISTVLYVYILFNFGLIGDCLINIYYTAMSVYGWIAWSKGRKDDSLEVVVTATTRIEWIYSGFLFLGSLLAVTIIYYYKPYIDATATDTPIANLGHLEFSNYLDILTTSIFLVGMWLMAKRRVENWILWIIGDIICIPMMLFKGLGITSAQYLVFTVLAIIGYINWKKNSKNLNSK